MGGNGISRDSNAMFASQFPGSGASGHPARYLPGHFELVDRCHELRADAEEAGSRPQEN